MQVDAAREQRLVLQLWPSLEYIRYPRLLPEMSLPMGSHGVPRLWRNISAHRLVRLATDEQLEGHFGQVPALFKIPTNRIALLWPISEN
jgi:hypothetical protein